MTKSWTIKKVMVSRFNRGISFQFQPRVILLTPTAVISLINHPGMDNCDLSSVFAFMCAGAALAPEKMEELQVQTLSYYPDQINLKTFSKYWCLYSVDTITNFGLFLAETSSQGKCDEHVRNDRKHGLHVLLS